MASTIKFANFKPDSAGIASVFKSGAMQNVVGMATNKMAAEANRRAVANRPGMSPAAKHGIQEHDPGSFSSPPYKGKVKVGRGTAFGVVKVNTLEGASDTKRNHTLQHLS